MYNLTAYASIARRLPISISQFLDDLDRQQLHFMITAGKSEADRDLKQRLENTKVLVWISVVWLSLGIIGLLFGENPKYEALSITLIVLSLMLHGLIFLRLLKK